MLANDSESVIFFIFYCYRITLTPEEGGGSIELVTNGRNIQVNETNVYDYVRLYATYRLIKTHEKSLEVSTSSHILNVICIPNLFIYFFI